MCSVLYPSGHALRPSGLSKQVSDEPRRDPWRIALRFVEGSRSTVHRRSLLGAGTLAGTRGERQPSPLELQLAEGQGTDFARLVRRLAPSRSP